MTTPTGVTTHRLKTTVLGLFKGPNLPLLPSTQKGGSRYGKVGRGGPLGRTDPTALWGMKPEPPNNNNLAGASYPSNTHYLTAGHKHAQVCTMGHAHRSWV